MAFEGERPLHETGKAAANRQSEPGSTVPAAQRAIHLVKLFEQRAELFLGNADACVDDGKDDAPAAFARRLPIDPQLVLTSISEFDGIANQVEENLPNSG